jgi:hypothetical protein
MAAHCSTRRRTLRRASTLDRSGAAPFHRIVRTLRPRAIRPAALAMLTGAVLVLGAAAANAQDGQPIMTNNYAVDLNTGPVIGSGRQVGMAGAFTALVDGLDGALWSPAAYASRAPRDASYWHFDGGLSGSWITNDFDNSGVDASRRYSLYLTGLGGLGFTYGDFGIGSMFELHSYTIANTFNVTSLLVHAGIAYNFFHDQLVLGIGARYTYMWLWQSVGSSIAQYQGYAGEVGAVWRPRFANLRIGIAAHTDVSATHSDVSVIQGQMRGGDCSVVSNSTCFVLPEAVHTPAQINVGIAYQFGPRPWNAPWENPHDDALDIQQHQREAQRARRDQHQAEMQRLPRYERAIAEHTFQAREQRQQQAELHDLRAAQQTVQRARVARYAALPRRYLLIALDAQITGPTTKSGVPNYGEGMDAFVLQTQHLAGANATISPRIGAESEVWQNRLVLRAGSYYEPSRYDNTNGRLHFTTGFDLRLFDTSFFGLFDTTGIRVTPVLDVANNYFSWGLGVGFWH